MNNTLIFFSCLFLFGCASQPQNYTKVTKAKVKNLKKIAKKSGSNASISYDNYEHRRMLKEDSNYRSEYEQYLKSAAVNKSVLMPTKYTDNVVENFKGSKFYWSKLEKCYNAFLAPVLDKETIRQIEAESKRNNSIALKNYEKRAKEFPDGYTPEHKKNFLLLLDRASNHYQSMNAARLQVCKEAEDNFKIKMLFNGKPVEGESLKYSFYHDPKNKIFQVKFSGYSKLMFKQYSNTAANYFRQFKVKGGFVGYYSDEVREVPFKSMTDYSPGYYRSNKWGDWGKEDWLAW